MTYAQFVTSDHQQGFTCGRTDQTLVSKAEALRDRAGGAAAGHCGLHGKSPEVLRTVAAKRSN